MDKKDIKKSYNPRAFEESDASLKLIQKILRIVMILECVVAVILGFVFLASGNGVNGVFGWLGCFLLFAGPALFIFWYRVLMFSLWVIYDIKMIRNALYDAEPSAPLKSFSGEETGMDSSSGASSSTSTGEPKTVYEYYENGNVKKSSDYDAKGSLKKQSYYDTEGKLSGYSVYEYDAKSNAIKGSFYDAEGKIDYYSVAEYDENGNMKKMSHYDADDKLESYDVVEYDKNGKKTKKSSYNVNGKLISVYEYDENGKKTKSSGYDAEGNLIYSK